MIAKVDGLLVDSHLEGMARDFALEGFEHADARQQSIRVNFALKALRIEVLRMLLGNLSFRELSRRIGASDLLADFCRVRQIDGIRGISKSTLERSSKFFRADQVRWMQQVLTEMCGETDRAAQLGMEAAVDTQVCLVDTTCLEANIHYPNDWVLLGDVTRTLLKAIKLIRAAGLLHRMPCEPEEFARVQKTQYDLPPRTLHATELDATGNQVAGQLSSDLRLLVRRKHVDNSADRPGGAGRVDRAEDQVARFRGTDRRLDRLKVA